MTIGNRIKKLRKAKGLTQQEFSNKLGISRSNIATYETREGNPGTSVIALICREFNVSEKWLRTGEGEMFVELPENEALAAQIQEFLHGGTDSFRERLVSLLLRLPPEHWEALERYALELVGELDTTAASEPEDTRTRDEKPVTEWTDEDIDAEVEDYRRELLEEKRQAESGSASSGTNGGDIA